MSAPISAITKPAASSGRTADRPPEPAAEQSTDDAQHDRHNNPAGSRPGITNLARAPTINPNMIQPKMLNIVISPVSPPVAVIMQGYHGSSIIEPAHRGEHPLVSQNRSPEALGVAHPRERTPLLARHGPVPAPDHHLPLANLGCSRVRRPYVYSSGSAGTNHHSIRCCEALQGGGGVGRLAEALLQIQRVAGEHLLRAHRSRQDLLVMGELDHRLHRLAVARQTIGQRVIPHQAAALGQGLLLAGELGPGAQCCRNAAFASLKALNSRGARVGSACRGRP